MAPTVIVRVAVPEITGGRFAPVAAADTAIENAGRDAIAEPSLTEMVIPDADPTSEAAGVPDKRPVAVEKVAHMGLPTMANVSEPTSGSVAVGWNV